MKKILLTGANGYVGKRLFYQLLEAGYEVIAAVRDKNQFHPPIHFSQQKYQVIEIDFSKTIPEGLIPADIQGAYYLLHSMADNSKYAEKEALCAEHFVAALRNTEVEQVIYLSGMLNAKELSEHLNSRKKVEEILGRGSFALTTLRAGIVIGSGGASFEIIRDLVEKLPIMVAPSWLNTLCQPIGIRDVLDFLVKSLFEKELYKGHFDIGGSSILSYKNMLLEYARIRGLQRKIFIFPLIPAKVSSYWLFFVTSTSFSLAQALVSSMKIDMIAEKNSFEKIKTITQVNPASYSLALERTFAIVETTGIPSSWKDDWDYRSLDKSWDQLIQVPVLGCFQDKRQMQIQDKAAVIEKIFEIGGDKGWYYGDFLWELRGLIDKIFGGVGLNRGRRDPKDLRAGDALDFWRVICANAQTGHLLLYAQMKLPGEAWLEFKIEGDTLVQTATFRPLGIWGRMYWYAVLPLHVFIFGGMLRAIGKAKKTLS